MCFLRSVVYDVHLQALPMKFLAVLLVHVATDCKLQNFLDLLSVYQDGIAFALVNKLTKSVIIVTCM